MLLPRPVVALGLLTLAWAFLGGAGLPVPVREPHAGAATPTRELAPALPPVVGVQRTLRLLASSTAKHPQVVRILFYGQSITEGTWWQAVADELRRRYPHADLVIENRALGGFSSQLLVKTAETDLYPFHPDLVIFHVFGAHDKYEDIIRRVRERTTAEILLQTDHVTDDAAFTEETNPGKLEPDGSNWSAFMNHRWIPSLATNYQAGLCDQRAAWKLYLRAHHLRAAALLRDQVHLNADGERLMAACVDLCLRRDPRRRASPAEAWVTTHVVGREVAIAGDGTLHLAFRGNRVDVVLPVTPASASARALSGADRPAAVVRIDGRRPSEWPELYGFTRAHGTPGGKWPPVADIGWRTPLLVEDWTLEVTRDPARQDVVTFSLTGSKTGPDGSGRSDHRFESRSGRVIIDPDAWLLPYSLALAGVEPVPAHLTVAWSVEPRFRDTLPAPIARAARPRDRVITVAHGLPNGAHTLEVTGLAPGDLQEIRVYRPPLAPLPPLEAAKGPSAPVPSP